MLVRDWLGEFAEVDHDRALAELARRYLAGHGPATDEDLARWAGVSLRDARAGLDLALRAPTAPLPEPRLLGSFEPVLLGWKSRELFLGEAEPLVVSEGIFRPFALVRGRAAATWRISRQKVALEPFGRLARADREALGTDARDVTRFLAG